MRTSINRRAITRASFVILGTTLAGISGCVFYSFFIRWEAEKCLEVVQQLHVGSTTEQDARKAMRPFRQFETDGTTRIEGKDYPTYTYQLENHGNHLLGIFHPARFQTGLTFRDGVLIERGAGFLTEPFLAVNTRESITGLLQNSSLDENASGVTIGVYDPPLKMDIFLDTRASTATQKAAYGYNLACFTYVRGCQDVHEILPELDHK